MVDLNPFDGDGIEIGGKSFGDIARGVGGYVANQMLGVDDFRRAYQAAKAGEYGRALKSFGTGVLEAGLNVGLPAAGLRSGLIAARATGVSPLRTLGSSLLGIGAKKGKTTIGSVLFSPVAGPAALNALSALGGSGGPSTSTVSNQTRPPSGQMTGKVDGYTISPYGAMPTTAGKGGTSGGAGGAGGSAGSTPPENIGTALPAVPPEVQAELDRQRIEAQMAYDDVRNRIAQQRTSGSVGSQDAIRAARRASTGGVVDIGAEAAEGGLGVSPAILGVAQDALRQREATDVAAARKGFMQLASELGMTDAQAKRTLDDVLAKIRLAELTSRAQTGMNYIPQMGGF